MARTTVVLWYCPSCKAYQFFPAPHDAACGRCAAPDDARPEMDLVARGITKVVLQVLFMQQNQRAKNGWLGSSSSTPSYSLICIGSAQRGHGSPLPGMTRDFFRLRFALNEPPAHFRLQKHERPQNASVRENKQPQRAEIRTPVARSRRLAGSR